MVHSLTHNDPESLGPYRLVARLGGGGMGMVYLAKSPSGRQLALKTMHARIASEAEFRTRFRLEIDAARVIGSTHGAVVIDADPLAATPWLATEYVLGPALDDAVALNGPLPEECVRALGGELCTGLDRLHQSDVVHRDLKPSNILVTAFGPKVIDFGIARAIGDDRLTQTGAAAGTPAFMSPEQATGQEHTALGDVFALAGVLVLAATGRAPFGNGQAADLLYRVRYGDPDLTGVPVALCSVLEPCLQKEPAQRPGMVELGELLGAGQDRFVDVLPERIVADIGRRGVRVWEALPQRQHAPDSAPEESTSVPGGSSRRKVLSLAAGASLALGAAYGSWLLLSPEDQGKPKDSASDESRPPNVAPQAEWVYESANVNQHMPARAVGPIVIVSTDGGLVGLDAEHGEELWVKPDLAYSAPATDGKRLYALQDANDETLRVAECELQTGTFGTPIFESAEFSPHAVHLKAASNDTIYLLSQHVKERLDVHKNWFFIGFDVKTGEEVFRDAFDEGEKTLGISGDLVAALGGHHIAMLWDDTVVVRDAKNGKEVWRKKIPQTRFDWDDPPKSSEIALSDTHLYCGSAEVLAYRLADGNISWRFGAERDLGEDFSDGNRRYGPPSIADGIVYVSEGYEGIVALDAESGALLWEQKEAAFSVEFDSPPVVGDKYVYGTVDGLRWIAAVDREKHTAMWTFNGNEDASLLRSIFPHYAAKRLIYASGKVVTAIPLE